MAGSAEALRVRLASLADAAVLVPAFTDADICFAFGWDGPPGALDIIALLRDVPQGAPHPRCSWVLERESGTPDDPLICGIAHCRAAITADSTQIELAYGLIPHHRGAGRMSRFLRLLLPELAMRHPGATVTAITTAENLASQASLRRAGFQLKQAGAALRFETRL